MRLRRQGLTRLASSRYGARIGRSKAFRRAVAFYRYVETSQPKAVGWIRFPTSGAVFVIVMFWLFILIWSLAVWPYYRSRWNVGSPPLAIRTGMFALGCFPFIFAFGAKWNIVGFIVGCSHEKLQVFHQWLSHLFRTSLTIVELCDPTSLVEPLTDTEVSLRASSQLYFRCCTRSPSSILA